MKTWLKYKDKWLEALTSGKYNQTRQYLKDVTNNSHCCLGVLCEVILDEEEDCEWIPVPKNTPRYPNFRMKEQIFGSVQQAPFPQEFMPYWLQELFIEMNDEYEASFKQIAFKIKSLENQ